MTSRYFRKYAPLSRLEYKPPKDRRDVDYETEMMGSLENLTGPQLTLRMFALTKYTFESSALAVILTIFKLFQECKDDTCRVLWVTDRGEEFCWNHLTHLAFYCEMALDMRAQKGRTKPPMSLVFATPGGNRMCRIVLWHSGDTTLPHPRTDAFYDGVILDLSQARKTISAVNIPSLRKLLERKPRTLQVTPELTVKDSMLSIH